MDKELQQVAPEAATGQGAVDKLVEVRQKSGEIDYLTHPHNKIQRLALALLDASFIMAGGGCMPAYRKASIRELSSAAYELDGRTTQGVLHKNVEGQWMIGSQLLDDWLRRNEGEEVVMILLSLDEKHSLERKLCRGCGREYIGIECPHCRDARRRLRGR